MFHCLLDSFLYMECRNEAQVFPTKSQVYSFPYASCLRKETFLTSNKMLGVIVGILWETGKNNLFSCNFEAFLAPRAVEL